MKPYRIDIPQADLDDLAGRLARTRFTRALPGDDHGVTLETVQRQVDYWRTGYDWRAWEARINAHPQFITDIDGARIHFLHVRSPEPDAFPLILTHGWPMSVVEYLDLIGPLTNPRGHGSDPATAFHLVIPSIPGFGFSGPVHEPGWNRYRVATAWAVLMERLGYGRYGAHGNDVGSPISLELGRAYPERVAGVHVTQVFPDPSANPAELGEDDQAKLASLRRFIAERGAYLTLNSTQPLTIAHALADSPAGQLAWSLQLFGANLTDDYVLTNVTIYWLTNTAGTSALTGYYENRRVTPPPAPTTIPVGVANFANDFLPSIRPLAERGHTNIVSWRTHDTGGHHATQEAPELLTEDIRAFFQPLRPQ